MSLESLLSYSLQPSSPSIQAAPAVYQPANPFAQLSNEFGLKEADEVHAWLFMKANSLRHQHERNAIHNHARESARTLLLKLQNLRDLGATAQQLTQAGLDTLKEFEASSNTMMAAFERFQAVSSELEHRYTQFDASASKPANELTFASIFEPSPSQANPVSPLLNVLEKYRYNHQPEPASVLATVNNKVNRIANVQPMQSQADRVKQRKAAVAQCLLTSMDPESITGAMPCLAKHTVDLSESEKKELDAAVPNLVAGKALTELAIVPAVVSKVVDKVVTVAVKGYVLGAVIEGQEETDKALRLHAVLKGQPVAVPGKFNERVEEARKTLNGENPEFNKIVRELVPSPVKSAGKAADRIIQQGVDYAAEIDRYSQKRFNTLPGVVQAGMVGTVEIGIQIGTAAVAGPVIRGSASLIRAAGRSVQAAAEVVATTSKSVVQGLESSDIVLGTARFIQAVTNTPTPAFALVPVRQHVTAFARCESGSVKLPTSLSELAKRVKEYMKLVELPLSQVELDKLIRKGGFREVPGGKGGHIKYLKETPERDVIIRPSGEVSIGVQHQILKKIARSKALESLQSSPETTIINPKVNTGFHSRPLSHRLDYSSDYFQAGNEFIKVQEFNGIFSRRAFPLKKFDR